MFYTLPSEILTLVVLWLDVFDIVKLKFVHRGVFGVLDSDKLWSRLCFRDFNVTPAEKSSKTTYTTHHVKCLLLLRMNDRIDPMYLSWKNVRDGLKNSSISPNGNRKTDDAIINLDILGVRNRLLEAVYSSYKQMTEEEKSKFYKIVINVFMLHCPLHPLLGYIGLFAIGTEPGVGRGRKIFQGKRNRSHCYYIVALMEIQASFSKPRQEYTHC